MADDRMKNDDLRDMGKAGEGQDYGQKQGQQTPGRNPQGGQQGGQHSGGQQQKNPRKIEDDDEFGGGSTGQGSGMKRGSQNR